MKYTVLQWCSIFGVELIDNDGFRSEGVNRQISLDEFLVGIAVCTILPFNRDKSAVLNALMWDKYAENKASVNLNK